jgi:hypothetical protein
LCYVIAYICVSRRFAERLCLWNIRIHCLKKLYTPEDLNPQPRRCENLRFDKINHLKVKPRYKSMASILTNRTLFCLQILISDYSLSWYPTARILYASPTTVSWSYSKCRQQAPECNITLSFLYETTSYIITSWISHIKASNSWSADSMRDCKSVPWMTVPSKGLRTIRYPLSPSFHTGEKMSSTLLITGLHTASSVNWMKATFSQHISLYLCYKCIHKYYSNSYRQRMLNILMQQTYYDMLNSYVASGRNWLRRLCYEASCPKWSVIVCSC